MGIPLVLGLGWHLALTAEPVNLTLPDAINIALDQNVGLKREQLNVDLDQNAFESAKGDKQPDLVLSGSETVSIDPFAEESIWDGEGEFSDNFRTTLSSRITLYSGGGIEAAIREAEAALNASRNDYDRERQTLLLNAVTRFLEVIVREKQVQISEEELANQIEELQRIRLNYENGIRVKSEVLRQEALVAQSKGRLIEARRIHESAIYTLKDILQIPAEVEILCSDPSDTYESIDSVPSPDMGTALANLDQRLDLEAQRSRLESARESLEVARSGGRLSIAASANIATGYSKSGKGGAFADRVLITEPSASAGISFNLPVFDRDRTKTNVIRSQILLRREELFYEGLQQLAKTDLYRSFLDFESAQAQLVTAVEQLNAADEALKAEQTRYEMGLATLLDVNSIRSQRLDAAVAVEQARFDLFTSRLLISYEDGTIEAFLLENLSGLNF